MQDFSVQTVLLLVLSVCVLIAIRITIQFRTAVANIQNHPGYRVLLNPASVLGSISPEIRGIALGRSNQIRNKHGHFSRAGWDIISAVSVYPKVQTEFFLADAAAIKEVTSSRYRFPKPVHQYSLLLFFGANIVASEGEEWKRFRKIAASAFSDRNNRLVWDETSLIMFDMFNNTWGGQKEIVVDHCVDITLQVSLSRPKLLGTIKIYFPGVGFGRKISWRDDQAIPIGHRMTFKEALHIVSTDMILRLIVPEWAMGLTTRLRNVRVAFEELEKYMSDLIQDRKTKEKTELRYDLFSSLLDANDDQGLSEGEAKLSTRELFGNIFIFQLAGHETTAHTLCFAFALLALYPDEQDALFLHIKQLLPDDRLPTYDEMPLFTYSIAVFYETLRMFPPAPIVPKISSQDTILKSGNAAGEMTLIPIPKGAVVNMHIAGLHFNSRYWEDPHTFKPSRFLKDWPRDAFMPFSAGARACLGRKFFETEGIVILTMMISRYKIEVKDEPQFAAETFEEKKARILATKSGLTL
ncbi:hypothetical protein PILCRDRAFT_7625 [Piloderma croceum F 1598]|uniref:Cytochrome P450 n=1 Tax=Piloderma croceum (strain F 1598) TaxID=765440 RepID=A0A0C3BZC0_PILCF|nr:hypothetical protein PILCRDRAFT_7625 [Piloderma croceum F 1598]